MHGPLSRLIWSIDAYEEQGPIWTHTLGAVRSLADACHPTILPVYVLSPAEVNLSVEFTPPGNEQAVPAAEAALHQRLSSLDIQGLAAPQVLLQGAPSLRGSVDCLLGHAEKEKADLILLGTHARRGVGRFFLGSFAETLMVQSRIPVLAVGPRQVSRRVSFDRVLFPTDLLPESQDLFERAVRWCVQWQSELTLFHVLPNPVEPLFESGAFLLGGSWVPVHQYFADDLEERTERLEDWANWARRLSVRTRTALDQSGWSISQAIARYAKLRKQQLIILSSRKGSVQSFLVGSTSRQVLRSSPCPVLVFHQDRERWQELRAA